MSSLAVPSAGYVERLVQAIGAARQGDLTEGDVNAIIRLTSISTLPIVRSLMEYHVKPALHDAVTD